MAWKWIIGLFDDSLTLFPKYLLYLILHLLASGDPDDASDCHGYQHGQAKPGSMNTSKIVVRRLRRNKSKLKRKRVMKPVFRETNSTW